MARWDGDEDWETLFRLLVQCSRQYSKINVQMTLIMIYSCITLLCDCSLEQVKRIHSHTKYGSGASFNANL